MAKRRARKAVQLALPLVPTSKEPEPPGLWQEVEALPAKVERYHRERRKLVKPRLRQRPLFGDDSPG